MNKLDSTIIGGHPVAMDDLAFLQTALTEGVKGLAAAWSFDGTKVILAGLTKTVSGGNTIFAPGWVCVNSEVYYVNGITIATVSDFAINIGNNTYDSLGDLVFEDLSTHSTYIVREGNIQAYTGTSGQLHYADFKTFKDALKVKGVLVDESTVWHTVGAIGEPTYNTNWSGTLAFRKNKLGYIEFKGDLISVGRLTTAAFTLPTIFRPIDNKSFCVLGISSGVALSNAYTQIDTAGNVYATCDTTVGSSVFSYLLNPATYEGS